MIVFVVVLQHSVDRREKNLEIPGSVAIVVYVIKVIQHLFCQTRNLETTPIEDLRCMQP